MIRAILALALTVLPMADALAQAWDRNRENCLETEATGTLWSSTSQLHCLKPDPQRTRRDPFGRCQERRFEVTMRNRCAFLVIANWRFNNGMRLQQRLLGPSQSFAVYCGQLSDQCDGSVIAYGEKLNK
jgi:hypothetical protein